MYQIRKCHLCHLDWNVEALLFLPNQLNESSSLAIFTHGYTTHKGTLISWGDKLANAGMPTLIFDLPGHYLGSFNEVHDFSQFQHHAHELFFTAYKMAIELAPELGDLTTKTAILGGHSLGALLALKALGSHEFSHVSTLGIAVGYGLQDDDKTHTLQGPFFKEVLTTRAQLVSPELSPDKLFPWVAKSKKELELFDQEIHLLNGINDFVISEKGIKNITDLLSKNNRITVNSPEHLPHHQPELAATHIREFLKSIQLI